MMSVINNPTAPSQHPVLHFDWRDNWAVREGDWKLLATLNKKTKKLVYSLHNLAEANPEVKDHANGNPQLVAHLTKLHEDWAKEVKPH